jgi:hypothetical protein
MTRSPLDVADLETDSETKAKVDAWLAVSLLASPWRFVLCVVAQKSICI